MAARCPAGPDPMTMSSYFSMLRDSAVKIRFRNHDSDSKPRMPKNEDKRREYITVEVTPTSHRGYLQILMRGGAPLRSSAVPTDSESATLEKNSGCKLNCEIKSARFSANRTLRDNPVEKIPSLAVPPFTFECLKRLSVASASAASTATTAAV